MTVSSAVSAGKIAGARIGEYSHVFISAYRKISVYVFISRIMLA